MVKKTDTAKFAIALLAIATMGSCAKEIMIEDESGATKETENSTLIVQTRTTDTSGGEISYPVNVFVFNSDNTCIATSVISDADGQLAMKLTEGEYNVYAVAGADEENYDIPAANDATTQKVITLKEGEAHGELMASTVSPVTLKEGGTNTLTIALNRKVMMIKNITIKDLPTTTTAVSVSLSPLYKNICLDGSYDGQTTSTISLTKGTDDNWTYTDGYYLLPATGDASISVAVTDETDTKTYSYTSKNELTANYYITIEGTYNSGEMELSGTLKGEEWAGDRTISFEFTDGTETTTQTSTTTKTEAPTVGTFYNNNTCFVVASTTNDDNSVTVTLMTTSEKTGLFTEEMTDQEAIKTITDQAVADLAVDGIEGVVWRLPTEDEFNAIVALADTYDEERSALDNPNSIANFLVSTTVYYCIINDEGKIVEKRGKDLLEFDVDKPARVRAFTTLTFK